MNTTFNENDIRPDELVKKQEQYCRHDIEFLKSRIDDFVEVACPACGKVNQDICFKKHDISYIECKNCGMLYISPRPTVEILDEYYSNSPNYKFFNDYIFPASKEVRREKIFIPRVKKILEYCNKYGVKKDKLIEIGAGFGIFCEETIKTKEFQEICGIEATEDLAQTCRNNGIKIYEGLIENINIEEKFNVAVAFEVIEHIFSPKDFIEKIANILEENGLLMLTFPNWEGFDISLLREYSNSIDPEHLNYFTKNSIKILLEECDFEILEIITPGELDVDIVSKAVQKNNLNIPNILHKICIDEKDTTGKKFQNFLKENCLSSHMMTIARLK